MEDEKCIIEAAINGNEESFTNLVLNYQQDLYKIALTRLRSEYDIEEAIQETMITAFKNLKKLKDASKFKKWLIKILINKCNEIYRRKKSSLVSLSDYDMSLTANNINYEIDSKLDFYKIIHLLNEKEKTVMVLYYSEKYTTKEIAEIFNKSENTIKSIIHRAKIKIKDKYQDLQDIIYY